MTGGEAYDARRLVDVAMGRAPADSVIRGGVWVCVQSGELIEHTDIAVIDGRIAFVGPDADHTVGNETSIFEADGRYLVPGLLDAHMHVESGMLTVTEFVRAVLPHGTTGMFIDPHEIANVFGLRGVRLMVDEAATQPIHVYVEVPSCVPSAPGLETPGKTIGPADVEEALRWPGIIGLGEMMNFPGVVAGGELVHAEMSATRGAGKVVGGHYASFDLGLPFHGYAAGGAEDDHEGTRAEDALARVRQGMRAMLRYGSSWFDVAAQLPAVLGGSVDARRVVLCTDDSHSQTLVEEGHMDRVVRHAVTEGATPMQALQMATINTAEHFRVDREIGMIAPGRCADVLLVRDLRDFRADEVIVGGRSAAGASLSGGVSAGDPGALPAFAYPDWARRSVHLPRPVGAVDFRLAAPAGGGDVTAHVIGVVENQAPTRHLVLAVPAHGGAVEADIGRDIAKIAVVERHHGTGRVAVGLVHGFGFTARCAVASTVAHDCHHLVVVGTADDEMAAAVNELAACGGGQIVVREGAVIGKVELPIGGLMSNAPAAEVASGAATVLAGFKACGCTLNNPNMQLSLLPLAVIPQLRLSDLGLLDVERFQIIDVLE